MRTLKAAEVKNYSHYKHFNKLKGLNVLLIFIIVIQYEQKIMDPGAVKTLKHVPLSGYIYLMSCD